MSTIPPRQVYRGFWVDYSRGNILGSTITIDSKNANIIVAFLSVLLTVAGAFLWDIIAFCLFARYRATSPRDETYRQRQAILRNMATPAAVLTEIIKVFGQDRKSAHVLRLLPLVLFAVLCSGGFLAAGVLSSQIVSTTNITILGRPSFNFDISGNNVTGTDPGFLYVFPMVEASINYVKTCYNTSLSNPACQVFIRENIPFDTLYNECPFRDLCMLDKNPALRMDTGLLWSSDTFGLNTEAREAVALRKVTTCAPLNLSQYERVSTADPDTLFSEDRSIGWDLGPVIGAPVNDTFSIRTVSTNTTQAYSTNFLVWYNATSNFDRTNWSAESMFEPIVPLQSPERDSAIFQISLNALGFSNPVDDPVFAAHKEVSVFQLVGDRGTNITAFKADDYARFIGCTEQYQFCLSDNRCTSLSSIMSASTQAIQLGLNNRQNATLYLYAGALIHYGLNIGTAIIYQGALLAQGKSNGPSLPLTPNHWELEVKYWMAIVLTAIQKSMADIGVGPGSFGVSDFQWPTGDAAEFIHTSQKMKAPGGISNISVLGFSLILSSCGLLILVNSSMLGSIYCLGKNRRSQLSLISDWDEVELLQLERLAHETSSASSMTK